MMLILYQKAVLTAIVFMLYVRAAEMQRQRELPVKISPVMIPGTSGECPSDDKMQESHNSLQNATREIIYQILGSPFPECGPGQWRRVFYLNASTSDQLCPDQWSLVTSPVRGCAGINLSCHSAFSEDINNNYCIQ